MLSRLRSQLERLRTYVDAGEGEADPAAVWALEDRVEQQQVEVERASARYVAALRSARVEAPDMEEATQPLVDWYRTLAVEAEQAGGRGAA